MPGGGRNPTHLCETLNLRIFKSTESLKSPEPTTTGTIWAPRHFELGFLRLPNASSLTYMEFVTSSRDHGLVTAIAVCHGVQFFGRRRESNRTIPLKRLNLLILSPLDRVFAANQRGWATHRCSAPAGQTPIAKHGLCAGGKWRMGLSAPGVLLFAILARGLNDDGFRRVGAMVRNPGG